MEIDRALLRKQAEIVRYRAKCVVTGDQVRCAGDFSMEATLHGGRRAGEIQRLVIGNQPAVRNLRAVTVRERYSVVRDNGGTARCGDGNRIERIELHGTEAVLVVRRDFQILATAIAKLERTDALASKPFRPSVVRELLLNQIGF